jgi:hypothetical protein
MCHMISHLDFDSQQTPGKASIAFRAMCAPESLSTTRRRRPGGQLPRAARALYRCVTVPVYIYSEGVARGLRTVTSDK